jgi:hypothetical protein
MREKRKFNLLPDCTGPQRHEENVCTPWRPVFLQNPDPLTERQRAVNTVEWYIPARQELAY